MMLMRVVDNGRDGDDERKRLRWMRLSGLGLWPHCNTLFLQTDGPGKAVGGQLYDNKSQHSWLREMISFMKKLVTGRMREASITLGICLRDHIADVTR